MTPRNQEVESRFQAHENNTSSVPRQHVYESADISGGGRAYPRQENSSNAPLTSQVRTYETVDAFDFHRVSNALAEEARGQPRAARGGNGVGHTPIRNGSLGLQQTPVEVPRIEAVAQANRGSILMVPTWDQITEMERFIEEKERQTRLRSSPETSVIETEGARGAAHPGLADRGAPEAAIAERTDRRADIETQAANATAGETSETGATVAVKEESEFEMMRKANKNVDECNQALDAYADFRDAQRLTYKIRVGPLGQKRIEYRMKGGNPKTFGERYYRMVEKALKSKNTGLLQCLLLDHWAKSAELPLITRTSILNCLDLAIEFDDQALLRRLVEEGGYDINTVDDEGRTRLDRAFSKMEYGVGIKDGIELELLKLGAVSGKTSTGGPITYLLHEACFYKNFQLIRYLVEHQRANGLQVSEDVNSSTVIRHAAGPRTPLVFATMSPQASARTGNDEDTLGVYRIVQYLLDHGAKESINVQTGQYTPATGNPVASGKTSLHAAASWGHLKTVALLLENGASPTLKDSQGRTPLDHARKAGRSFGIWTKPYKEVARLLEAHLTISSITHKK